MENTDCDKSAVSCDDPKLSRSRSIKSKQLVRSQAIRESQSPPRTASPAVAIATLDNDVIADDDIADNVTADIVIAHNVKADTDIADNVITDDVIADNDADSTRTLETSSRNSDDSCSYVLSVSDNCNGDVKKLPVEIQITSGTWELEPSNEQRRRTKQWLGNRNASDSSRDLLSNNPRVTCVCGNCGSCPQCKGRRRRRACPTKQDSGIVCPEECPECSDTEPTGGPNNDGIAKSDSLDVEEQTHYCRCPEKKEKPKSLSLSRTDSVSFADGIYEPTGPELVNFIKETLNKNAKDRHALMRIEKELHALVNDIGRNLVRFPVMTSYNRMLVHRCATLFQLSHHLDLNNKACVLVSKSGTSGGRIPCTSFKEWCTINFPPSPVRLHHDSTNAAKSILKRARLSLEEGGGEGEGEGDGGEGGPGAAAAARSLEQRERDYERVRRRIFCTEKNQWPWLTGQVKVLAPEGGRNKLLKVHSLEGNGARSRGAVSKSHSFGGYSAEPPLHPPRLLSRQGDLASSSWRLSPSSSGYKTLSLRSTDSVTPSPTGGASPEPSVAVGVGVENAAVVWAVTDMSAVPTGALVIHPQTGRPLTNSDGTIYHFDPQNPPIIYDPATYTPNETQDQTYDQKRRGRLEKQQSFIDNECECQLQDDYRGKCCCDYSRQDGGRVEKELIKETKALSPKTYEKPQNQEPTNQRIYEQPTNHRKYEQPTKQSAEVTYEDQSRCYEQNAQINDGRKINQDVQEIYPQYVKGIPSEEMPSPHAAATHYVPQEVSAQVKVANNVSDTQMHPVSLSNMMYTTQVQPYPNPYMNQCRVDAPLQQVYQQVMPLPTEEQKPLQQSPHNNDNTFRIDPSYPYAAVEYGGCGACLDTNMQHRGYNMQYTMEAPPAAPQPPPPATVMPSYPVGNLIMPQMHPYQEQLQWANVQPQVGMGVGVGVGAQPKLYIPEVYPLVQYPPPQFQQYNVLYPQVIPQHYSICQPFYPVIEKQPDINLNTIAMGHSKRNSASNSARNTPHPEIQERKHYDDKERTSEIALKIQQIKEQMAQLNVQERDRDRYKKEDLRQRNSGNGILGNYPVANFNGRVAGRGAGADPRGDPRGDPRAGPAPRLSPAARAIVDSIRQLHGSNTYQETRRSFDGHPRFDNHYQRQERPDRYRQRQEERDAGDRRFNIPLQYRPPYILRQMSPSTWCRRSPGPVHPAMNQPRRPHPDPRNARR